MTVNVKELADLYASDPNPLTQDDADYVTQLISVGKVDEAANFIAKFLMSKMFGAHVRISLAAWTKMVAQMCDKMFADYLEDQAIAAALQKLVNKLQNEWQSTLSGLTEDSEVKNARIDVYGVVWATLKKRLDNIEHRTPDFLYSGEVADERRVLQLKGLTTSSEPIKYQKVADTSDELDYKNPLMIQPLTSISTVKVSEF